MTSGVRRLLVTADAVGGVWQYVASLVAALPSQGFRPTVALLGPAPSAAQRAELPADVALIETGLPLDWLAPGPAPVLAAGEALARLAADYDLVQLNSPALAAAARFPVPSIAVAHGCGATWWEAMAGGALPSAMAWQAELAGAGLRRADRVVAPTAAHAAAVQRCFALPSAPLVVHNGRPPAAWASSGGEPVAIFTAGRLWDRAKEIATLDQAAAALEQAIHAAGPVQGPQGEQVAPQHLALLGSLSQPAVAARLAHRPIFVSTARFEPFGLAVLEAAQAGCSLVLSDIPTFRELWGGVARFVAPGDATGFARAIADLLADPPARHAAGAAAAARGREFTPARTAEGMAAVLHDLLPRAAAA